MSSHPDLSTFAALSMSGFNAYVGTLLRDPSKVAGDERRFAFLPETKHLNGGGALHGGFLMTLADNVLGFTVHEQTDGRIASTVTLNTDFLAGGVAGSPVWGRAAITRRTRSLIFVGGDLSQDGKLLMTATGIWKIIGA
ncbi:MAG: PaaI family thioesterase [Micropepsaceae bacterium]